MVFSTSPSLWPLLNISCPWPSKVLSVALSLLNVVCGSEDALSVLERPEGPEGLEGESI